MQQQISIITLGVQDLDRSLRFYGAGFGWAPLFNNGEIAFYQMNGFVLGTWLQAALDADVQRPKSATPGAFSLAHNVEREDEVNRVVSALVSAGGRVLRIGDAPPQGGFRAYVADPDDHAWEIAWNPDWTITREGHVIFGV